jgi:trehalose 6-phosphate phosphatase
MSNHDAPTPAVATEGVRLSQPGLELLVGASLFLDFDGTLVEIADHPDAVIVSDDLKDLLRSLSVMLHGRVGIISGRPIGQLHDLIGTLPMAYAGSHGAEIVQADGTHHVAAKPAGLNALAQEMGKFITTHPGVMVERKPYGVALHYRAAPHAEAASRDLATTLSHSSGFTLQSGKMVFELRAPGSDKGTALRLLSGSPSMRGTKPVFVGDDDTDEAAFIVAAELGGAGILVGPDRPTAAKFRLPSVRATIEWLRQSCRETS